MTTKRISHRIEYATLLSLQLIVSIIPRRLGLALGGFFGRCLYLSGAYRKIVRKNMEFVNFWPPKEQEKITKRLYRTMGRYAVDFLRPAAPQPPHRVHNVDSIQMLLDRGKGIIVLLAHFGNWELLADMFGSKVQCLNVVAKPMRNRFVDKWLARKRAAASVKTIYIEHALRKIYEALKNNELVAVLIDQHAGSQGTQAPFLGKETSTVRTVAGLVAKTGCAVLPTYAVMRDDGSYDIEISVAPGLDIGRKSTDECIAAFQAQHNAIISDWIKQNPEHWFGWFHKRFREHIRYNA